jgi:hypothetical protein
MNQAIPLYVVLIVAGAAGLLYLVHHWVCYVKESAQRMKGLQEAIEAQTVALNEIQEALSGAAAKEMGEHLAAVPKLLDAVAKIGGAQLEILQTQRPHRPNTPTPPRDNAAANLEQEITDMVRSEGCSREEAMLRLNPANDQTVWGNAFYQGWR